MFNEASPDSSPKEMKSISKTLIPIKLERYEKLGPIKRRMEEVVRESRKSNPNLTRMTMI